MLNRCLSAQLSIVLFLVSLSTVASAQIKPRFVIAIDTSGSMTSTFDGSQDTSGDGVGRLPVMGDNAQRTRNGVYYGCGNQGSRPRTVAGIDRNNNCFPDDSRIYIAKDAVTKMILAFGDVEWALSRFIQTQALNADTVGYQVNIDASNGCSGTEGNCSGNYTINYKGACCSSDTGNCPTRDPGLGEMLVGFPGVAGEAFASMDNRTAILRWLDNVETAFHAPTATDRTNVDVCDHANGNDCELRIPSTAYTPLGGIIHTSGAYALATRNADTDNACRRYSVLLVTDGDETCDSNPNQEAFALAYPGATFPASTAGIPTTAPDIRTFVVGINLNTTALNDIAAYGGTTQAYFANTPGALAAALSDIVSKSIPHEICNGLDDDCDGAIDEDLPRGQPGSAAQTESLFCDGEAARTMAQNDQVRKRKGNYTNIANSTPITDPVVCGRVLDTCANPGVDDDCDGAVDEDGSNLTACHTCPGAPEMCNGIDDDCDGIYDEIQGSGKAFSICPAVCSQDVVCGSGVGTCHTGFFRCVNGTLGTTCEGATGRTTEVCDQKDNDCNGIVDDVTTVKTCSTPSTGICRPGVQICAKAGEMADANGYHINPDGSPVCEGQVLPEDHEVCDVLDHDCNGDAFSCTSDTCVVGPDPIGVGDPCGSLIGACSGKLRCDMNANPPVLVCDAPAGMPEVCNGIDDDCDGKTDEGVTMGGSCGHPNIGECRPGTLVCLPQGGTECQGAVDPTDEVCDGLDNDCDGMTDEGLGLGDDCGSDIGECKPGKLACAAGKVVCTGGKEPQAEVCDCADNDCDGKIDEDSDPNAICPGGSMCAMCRCALPCAPSKEFEAQCPQGKAAVTDDQNRCFCVGEQCKATECQQQTIMVNDEVQCAPKNDLVSACFCKNNACSFKCAGTSCSDGLICDPTDGRCKQKSCLLPQFRCPDTQYCSLVDQLWQCIDDPCASATCGATQACRVNRDHDPPTADCFDSCATKSCSGNTLCKNGECAANPCATASCDLGKTCNPKNGQCVFAGACVNSGCPEGEVCEPVGGACIEDPCLSTRCPYGEICRSGECAPRCPGEHQLFCDNECVNPDTSRTHCGASNDCKDSNAGETCGTGLVCSLGKCSDSCANGLVNCSSECVDPKSDLRYCGAKGDCTGTDRGETCAIGYSCSNGRCKAAAGSGIALEKLTAVNRVIASGGGGCACDVALGATQRRESARSWLGTFLFACGLLMLGRRRFFRHPSRIRARALLWLMALVVMPFGQSCKVDTFCLDCPNGKGGFATGDGGSIVGGRVDGGSYQTGSGGRTGTTSPGVDGGGIQSGDGGGATGQADGGCMAKELCNGRDDDCDGVIDEDVDLAAEKIDLKSDVNNCGACGKACVIEHAFNQCSDGQCSIDPTQGDKGCDVGFHDLDQDPSNGCEYACSKTMDDDHVCDLFDSDCDGRIDEDVDLKSDPENCGHCGSRCSFPHASAGMCDSGTCVFDPSKCDDHFADLDHNAANGCEYHCPGTEITPERCDLIDNDCDGLHDEDVDSTTEPMIGQPCGQSEGECSLGVYACVGGEIACTAQTPPVPESCDGLDNDCDTKIDEGFDKQTDVANCGACGMACQFGSGVSDGHAVLVCSGGTCQIGACIGNFADQNHDYTDGCEVACTLTGFETCDGADNDCNGIIDDLATVPSVVCVPQQKGVCAQDQATIGHLLALGPKCTNGNLSCDVQAVVTAGFIQHYEAVEVSCDGFDNDCDGATDEMIPAIGQACSKGTGACRTVGVNICDSQQQAGYRCDAATPGTGSPETCNGIDDDCDMVIDNFAHVPTPGTPITNISLVDLGVSTSHTVMMSYEASRPDADHGVPGTQTKQACSAGDHVPWANVSWGEASAACCALNANGQCSNDGTAWRLCDSATFEAACRGPASACDWAYSDINSTDCNHGTSDVSDQNTCLGLEAFTSGLRSCSDGSTYCATETGSSSFPECRQHGWAGDIYDLSGNLQEWTNTPVGTGIHEIRGGSFNDPEYGRACSFNFTAGDSSFRFPNTGFRCCWYPASSCTTYSNNTTINGVVDAGMTSSTIVVPAGGAITSLHVLDATGNHSRFNDLTFTLASPAGVTVSLLGGRCSNSTKNWAFDLGDDAATAETSDNPFCNNGNLAGGGVANAYRPQAALSAFNGQSSAGTWSLHIYDASDRSGNNTAGTAGGDRVQITGWSLQICRFPG